MELCLPRSIFLLASRQNSAIHLTYSISIFQNLLRTPKLYNPHKHSQITVMSKPSLFITDLTDIDLEPQDFASSLPIKKVPYGDVFEAARAGDVDRLSYLLESGINVNARDQWDSVALYYACLAGHLDAARMLLENGAICDEHTFDGDRCHYAALNLKVRKLLKAFEARPPPLGPLQSALRETFLGCLANRAFLEFSDNQGQLSGSLMLEGPNYCHFPPDVVFYVHGRPIEAHRVILSSRSPFFRKKFETDWKNRRDVRFSKEKLSYPALYSLLHFFYSDRLEVAVDDMEDLIRICKVCGCEALRRVIEKEQVHQRYADYKALNEIDNSQRRFILQGLSLPEEHRLPASLHHTLQLSLTNSCLKQDLDNLADKLGSSIGTLQIREHVNDLADICIRVDARVFRCHQVILASRSEYFRTRISRMDDFLEANNDLHGDALPCLEEHDLSHEAFEKMIEYMYTDGLKDVDPQQAEELFDAASRYLLFPLKRAVADALLPHLEMASPSDLCHWLLLADIISSFVALVFNISFISFRETEIVAIGSEERIQGKSVFSS
ncbi:BTB/POZ domain-containing protein At2g04740 isoform X2 [Amaranthus tricolor]|uniref:BTB/POZ domain-containing protein At2g04740 isoform X2 n=1 Tax=Amaranthus tricolor TaxID=29722 RepID=UPI00258F1C78|nr:BTB/POZ domain-containing protein At2g04740 isoform X2 [Amaranthus tricolor]